MVLGLSDEQKTAKKEQFLQANNASLATSRQVPVKASAKPQVDNTALVQALHDKLPLADIATQFALAQTSVIDAIGVLLRENILQKEAIEYLLPDQKTQKLIKNSQKN